VILNYILTRDFDCKNVYVHKKNAFTVS